MSSAEALGEPPAFGLALDDPAVATYAARLAPVHATAPDLSPEEFLRRFVAALGEELPADFTLESIHRKGVEATRLSPEPATAPIAVESLAASWFPKLVASGPPRWRRPAIAWRRSLAPSALCSQGRNTARNGWERPSMLGFAPCFGRPRPAEGAGRRYATQNGTSRAVRELSPYFQATFRKISAVSGAMPNADDTHA